MNRRLAEKLYKKVLNIVLYKIQIKMRAVNYSELRQNLKANLDNVTDNEELLVVHRSKGKSIVMMSLTEFNSLQETIHLNSSKTNRQRLEKAVENINSKTNSGSTLFKALPDNTFVFVGMYPVIPRIKSQFRHR